MTDVRQVFKRWPTFYYFVATVFGPLMFSGPSGYQFLRLYPRPGKTLNLGSGPRVLAPDVVNVDIHDYPGVSIIADVCSLPVADASVSRIVCDNVLEHVKNPEQAVSEMRRVLERGGIAYIATPYMYPFHSSPNDYYRWSSEGLGELFKDFELAEIGVRAGPFSALDALLCHMVGTIFSFGSPTLNSLFTNLSMFVFFPIKLPDLLFNHWPGGTSVAAVLYCIVRKP